MMDTSDVVRIEGVTKRFGGTVALHSLDLSIRAGEFVTFLGPSGCGKSTTLRILGGFERPDEGRVILDGEDVTRLPPNKRRVNMVFQDYALFPHMTVRRNIAFGLELKGMTRSEIHSRSDALMSFLELAELADRMPDQLSGGQRQRVALARALAPDPALLLLDEPLAALDAKLRGQVQAELKAIQRRTSKTFCFVTHDQDEALTMSDRIVVMNAGRVEQDGAPEELYFSPASRFVAGFLGETNLLTGHLVGIEGDEAVLAFGEERLVGRIRAGAGLAAGRDVAASVRLEKVAVSRDRPALPNALAARITGATFKGSRTELSFRLEERPETIVRSYVDNGVAREFGDGPVWIGWPTDAMSILRD